MGRESFDTIVAVVTDDDSAATVLITGDCFFENTFDETFHAPTTVNSTFTSKRPTRVKNPELSSDSSSDSEVDSADQEAAAAAEAAKAKKTKNKQHKVKCSRSWIQFRELS